MVFVSISLKILVGKILLGIFLTKLVGKVLLVMLGIFFENVPVGKFVWNIGKIFETLTWENFCLGSWGPFEDTILGTLGEIWENFYLGKFCKI